jgi:hypothetical protein
VGCEHAGTSQVARTREPVVRHHYPPHKISCISVQGFEDSHQMWEKSDPVPNVASTPPSASGYL